MRLLLDQNLSLRLVDSLGHPPKVVWVRRGNCSTREIEGLLRQHAADLLAFEQDPEGSFLAIG